jgi:16S rRNA U516 pseudouridylate synthase RsuA-like enzyme
VPAGIWKRYTAQLAAPLTDKDAAAAAKRFASGHMQLQGDRNTAPLLPAALTMVDDCTAEISICEGRYHQVNCHTALVLLMQDWVGMHAGAVVLWCFASLG